MLTGSQGFIGSYLAGDLLDRGYKVIGVDNFSKYGKVTRPHDHHPNFTLLKLDLARNELPVVKWDPDYIIAGAAMIGGISYFHKYAYDLLATNERIIANTFGGAIRMKKLDPSRAKLKRMVVISSSMVFEGAEAYCMDPVKHNPRGFSSDPSVCFKGIWPTPEDAVGRFPPPLSTYGFQKLATEYFAKGAWEQYKLPYTIVRPFNCVGVGEGEAIGEEQVMSGNIKLMMSHVLPDLVNKCLQGQDPLRILGEGYQLRCYTNGRDVSRGIIMAMEEDLAENEDFNISTSYGHTVLQLAEIVWKEINPSKPFRFVTDEPFKYDVQRRMPDVSKAHRLLGFEAKITLEESVKEVIQWMTNKNCSK